MYCHSLSLAAYNKVFGSINEIAQSESFEDYKLNNPYELITNLKVLIELEIAIA